MKVLICLCLTIALLLVGCSGANQIANGAESINFPLDEEAKLSLEADIQKLQQDLIALESRLSELEKTIEGDLYGTWGDSSIKGRLNQIEGKLNQIEEMLGISTLEWPGASNP